MRGGSFGSLARALLGRLADLTPRRAMPAVPSQIGIFLYWGIGDAVQMLPFLRALRDFYPKARITALGPAWIDDVFAGQGLFDARADLNPPWARHHGADRVRDSAWRRFAGQFARLRRTEFDLVIGLRPDPRDAALARLLRTKAFAGIAGRGPKGWISLDLGEGFDDLYNASGAKVAAHAAKRLTGSDVSPLPRFPVLPPAPQFPGRPLLAISFGASHPIRRWNGAAISRVLTGLRSPPGTLLLVSHPDSPEIVAPPGWNVIRWAGSLSELRDTLTSVDVLFCTDSGVMHIGDAAGCRVVALFTAGNISRFAPLGQPLYAVEPMPCRPCYDRCIYDSPRCVDQIDEAAVSALLDRTLSRAGPD